MIVGQGAAVQAGSDEGERAGRGAGSIAACIGFVDTKMAKSKVRPLMISVERAVDVLLECLDRKPARRTCPRAMQLLVSLMGLGTRIKLWLA